jgi:PAS domain S-box-containing protein
LQRQLAESQEKYRLLFERAPCHISIQDRELNIVDANHLHREAFGTYYGCKCYNVYKQSGRECEPCIVRETFADGELRHHEEVVFDRQGRSMNVMVTTAPLHNSDGEIEHVIEMSTDITRIRELQSKLSSVGMIISTISHDLKGLLNGLDGGIYLVDTGLKKDNRERVHTGWEMVRRNVDRIRSTVMDILYYARDREPDYQEISALALLDEVYGVMAHKAQEHGITFGKPLSEEELACEADARALRSLLVNLVDNAIDACRVDHQKQHHEVQLSARSEGGEIRFEVSDNGIGMDREAQQKAFTLFFSAKGQGGTGLGLFIANKIAQAHGGRVEVVSQPERGSRFTVCFPRRRPGGTQQEAAGAE